MAALTSCTYASLSGIVAEATATAAGVRAEWKRTNDLLGRLTKPQTLFGLAAAGAAGAAVGGFVASLAIDGIRLGAKALVKLLTMEDREREIVEKFTRAREEYERIMDAGRKLETSLDALLRLEAESAGAGVSVHELVLAYGAEKAALGVTVADRSAEHAELVRAGDASCAARYHRERVAPVEERWKGITRILGLLEGAEAHQGGLCDRMASQLESLERIGDSLNQARAHLLAGRETFLRMNEERFADALEAVERAEAPGRYGRIQRRKEHRAVQRATRLMRRDRRRSWRDQVRECVEEREKAEPEPGRLFHKGSCEAELSYPGTGEGDLAAYLREAGWAFKGASSQIRKEHERRMEAREAGVTVDPAAHVEGSRAWHRWFEEIADGLRIGTESLEGLEEARREGDPSVPWLLRVKSRVRKVHEACSGLGRP